MTAPLREMVIDQLRSRQHLPVRVDEVEAEAGERVEPAVTAPPAIAPERPEPILGDAPAGEPEESEPQLDAPAKPGAESPGRGVTVRVRRDWSGGERRATPHGAPPPGGLEEGSRPRHLRFGTGALVVQRHELGQAGLRGELESGGGGRRAAKRKNGGVDGTRTRDLLRDRQAF